ncbi:ferredoxin [Halogeometricum borinquense]|uniref:Ferredoxin n=1 Tax=Halogeometricum borinquense TaxID=60847 RepID=A0A6C0UP65_9EURY|nr:ferredoxin [Halogeometricum borinquense]QIB76191.1 ferredoxin [Halogeometricum borinquense]QIQ75366.1 ferredoxin [Halogeometricum borinquense]
MFEIEIDRTACDGIFACLARDGRFVEDETGLATIDADAEGVVEVARDDERNSVVATVEGNIDDAQLAAQACPPDAITVREVDT